MAMRQSDLALLLIVSVGVLGAAPSRTQTYTAGETIKNEEVTENEDNIFSYLQAGVDTYATNSIPASALQDASVTTAKIATGAVTTTLIADSTITATDLATDSVESAEIAANAVGASEIATDGVGTAEIADNTVTPTDFASTLTMADGDYFDLSAILHDDTALQGLRLPQIGGSASAPTSGEGQHGWDQTNNRPLWYNGSFWQSTVGGWIQFNGAGTPSITDSFNVTGSITDNGTGDWTFSWDNDFANNTYTAVASVLGAGGDLNATIHTQAVGSCRVTVADMNGARTDDEVNVLAVGDQ